MARRVEPQALAARAGREIPGLSRESTQPGAPSRRETNAATPGAQVENPGCSICQSPGIVLNEEICISATTRNSHGRIGGPECADAQIYLASPATVTAAAIAGEITDPREFLDA